MCERHDFPGHHLLTLATNVSPLKLCNWCGCRLNRRNYSGFIKSILSALLGIALMSIGNALAGVPDHVDAVLETGPDDSPGLRIQFGENALGKTVWTVLYGDVWQRFLRGQVGKAAASGRICTGWGTPSGVCEFRQGEVEFYSLVPKRAGQLVQGVVWYRDAPAIRKITLPFATTMRGERCFNSCPD